MTDYTPTSNQIQEIPFGYCQCGCGQKTAIARQTNSRKGYVAGQPYRYARGHSDQKPVPPQNEYAPWVKKYGLFEPYGKCQCGCGQDAPIAKGTVISRDWVKGLPKRFTQSHGSCKPVHPAQPQLCECGCGQYTAIAKRTDAIRGHIKGQPMRFVVGHKAPKPLLISEQKLCECGCGQYTKIATRTDRRQGKVKGQPMRYLYNHHVRDGSLPVAPNGYKTCTRCRKVKLSTVEFFGRDNKSADGFRHECKECRVSSSAAFYIENKDRISKWAHIYNLRNRAKIREAHRLYHLAHRDQHRAKAREYRLLHREETAARNVAYYRANRETRIKNSAQWKKDNPGRVRAYNLTRLAIKKGAQGTHTAQDVDAQYAAQKGKCYYCHCKVGKKYHVDHVVPLSRGGSNGPENLVVACISCNTSKRQRMPHEWIRGGRLL